MAIRDIIIFTQFYPYTYYDVYFERELFELSKYYDRVFLISGDPDSTIQQPTPANTRIYRFAPSTQQRRKLFLLRHLFRIDFVKEMWHISKTVATKNLVHAVWYALSSLEKSDRYKKFLSKLMSDENISANNITVYSHWMLEHAHAAGLIKRRFPGMKIVVRAHGSDLYFDRSPIGYLPLKKLIFEDADAIFFISENGRNYFQSFHRIRKTSAGKLRVSRLGLFAAKSPQLKEQGEKSFFRIVSNAHIQPLKRIDLIAEALRDVNLRIEWIHFGDMHERTDAFNAFRKNVNELLKENPNITVMFKGGVTNREIISFYEDNFVDLFINVSTTEGIPVSIMEAFSFGIPAIATIVGGNPEIVNDNNGILLPAFLTETDLANAIRNFLLKTISEREKVRLNAFNTWKEKFNAEINYPEFAQKILSLSSTTIQK
ncbi:MAG TPA: glycosyltransferase [Chitinophagales bacterium]|nr:glycosyltransferase [Chitinophagales bacterium]